MRQGWGIFLDGKMTGSFRTMQEAAEARAEALQALASSARAMICNAIILRFQCHHGGLGRSNAKVVNGHRVNHAVDVLQ